MKNILSIAIIIGALMLNACGGHKDSKDAAAGTETATAAPAEKVPTMTVNEADWEIKDLNPTSKIIPVSMKVPKGAKLEKNGNGGVDVTVSDFYVLTVYQVAVSSVKEAMDDDKKLTVNNTTSYKDGKVVVDDPDGFVYTYQMKDEANGTKYPPQSHFYYYFTSGPDGAVFSVHDDKPLSGPMVSEAAYTLDIAKQVYAIVKGSASVNGTKKSKPAKSGKKGKK
jgi:hypothetical protein